jgi:hypothetical protein
MKYLGIALLLLASASHSFFRSGEGEKTGADSAVTLPADTAAARFRRALESISTPELERRKSARRQLQQRTYAEILDHTLRDDGLGALLAYLRGMLRLEFSLPQNTLYYYVPVTAPAYRDTLPGTFFRASSGPFVIPLREDRDFPEDPWRK